MDKYGNFAELKLHAQEGRDYRIHERRGSSRYAIVAIHGGWIERGTRQVADAIAGQEHSYYCFDGLHNKRRRLLHITSDYFNEPRCIDIVTSVDKVISIHGALGMEVAIYAGGLDLSFKANILAALTSGGFNAVNDPSPTRQGKGITNVCNRGKSGTGVQLELTVGLRKLLFQRSRNGRWFPTQLFDQFITCIRELLLS